MAGSTSAEGDRSHDNGRQAGDAGSEALHGDGRDVARYLTGRESDEYIAIMDVLEASVTELNPSEIAVALAGTATPLTPDVVSVRLERLAECSNVTGTSDEREIKFFQHLLARFWRYTPTAAGRKMHRFYRQVLAGMPTVREIPLASLNRVVRMLGQLTGDVDGAGDDVAELIGQLFTSHDDLDAALVGAEEALTGLANRFDLDVEGAAELKGLLVDYATRVAAELDRGAALAYRHLTMLRPHFETLAAVAVAASDARVLIERGALSASRGGRTADWHGLMAWFDPSAGRAARFGFRLVRALPGMHANLRRRHSSVGAVTSRTRILAFARAAADPRWGTLVTNAALGDHSWRKLHGAAEDADLTRPPSWRGGPTVEVPDLLRKTGTTGARGRAPSARQDGAAREVIAARRAARLAEHRAALREILSAPPGEMLSDAAARVALRAMFAAARSPSVSGRRVGDVDGLACTLVHTGVGAGLVAAPTWRAWVPGRLVAFHWPGTVPVLPEVVAHADPDLRPLVVLRGAA